jgi:hypothetical protein
VAVRVVAAVKVPGHRASERRSIRNTAADDWRRNKPFAHPSQALHIGKAGITRAETRELQRLLDRAADSCDAAAVMLEEDGPPPTGSELQRIRELTAHVGGMLDRIGAILGSGHGS